MIDLLRKYAPAFTCRHRLAWQVKRVLSKILLCRTPSLRHHVYECPVCQQRYPLYNSCADRHCPLCSGARRGNWLEKTRDLLPGVTYFQVVFTLPDRLSSLILGNRRVLYDLLFQSAWRALDTTPPHGASRPEQVLKYLARYLTGGPISDQRIIADEAGRVTFWARSKDKVRANRSRPFSLPGREFVRRWVMHILPKGYTRSRQFGGDHGRKREAYLASCRQLLAKCAVDLAKPRHQTADPPPIESLFPHCPRCDVPLCCVVRQQRPSWKWIFQRRIYQDAATYSPMHHVYSRAPPPFPLEVEGVRPC